MKRIIAVLIIVLVLTIFVTQQATGNPFMYHNIVSPPEGSVPLKITVISPSVNNKQSSDVNVTLNISAEDTSMNSLLDAYLKADWLETNTTVYKQNLYAPEFPKNWDFSIVFSNVPEGKHTITIYALGDGCYVTDGGLTANIFDMTTVSTIAFTIDRTPPQFFIVSPTNISYYQSDIPLNFRLTEPSSVSYSLDGNTNVTLTDDITLSNISIGSHNLTLYVNDAIGNMNAQTVNFSVEKPIMGIRDSTTLIAILVVPVVIVCFSVGLFLIRRHQKP